MVKKSVYFFLSAVACLFLCAGFVLAQETTGSLEGFVKDSAGAVVPDITLTIANAKGTASSNTTGTGFKRTITTNEDGFFRVLQIPPGIYDVITTASGGFGAAKYENITVAIGQTTQLEITLSPGSSVTTVDVNSAGVVQIDTTSNAIQTSVNAQLIELIPKGNDFTGVLKTIPGTRPESRTGGFSVDGSSGAENVFVIDGQDVTNFRTGTLNGNYAIPVQFVQEVQVKSSGFSAEFGGATGGVISVVTKGGSNQWRGEFGMQFETPRFNGSPRPSLVRFSSGTGAAFVQSIEFIRPQKSEGTNVFPTANLSGPIFKDRLFFFGSYSPQIFDTVTTTNFFTNVPAATRTLTATETFRLKRVYEYALGRLDAVISDNLRLTGTYLWNPISDEGSVPFGTVSLGGAIPSVNFGGSIGTLTGRALTDRQGGRQTASNFTAQAIYTPNSNSVYSVRFSRGFLNEKLGAYFVPPGTQIVCQVGNTTNPNQYPGGCTQGFSSPANSETLRDISIRWNYEFDATYIFGLGGRHELKGGYQRAQISNDVVTGFATKGRITFSYGSSIQSIGAPVTPSGPICATGQTTGCVLGSGILRRQGTFGEASNLSQALYIQDKYQPFRRLTLNLGVRIEKEDLPSFNSFAAPINFGWGDKIAPRLGFAFDLFGDGNTKIFGSYGKFYDRLKFNIPRSAFGGDFFLEDFFEIFPGESFTFFTLQNILGGRSRFQRNLRVAANDPTASATLGGRVDPNLKPFSQTEFTFGFERQFTRRYSLRVRYTFKNVDNVVEDAGVRNAADSEEYIIGNPGSGLHLETLQRLGYTKFTTPQRRYDGIEFVFERKLLDNWYFNANYTYSRLFGNYSGLASSDEINQINGRLSPGTTRAFDLPFIGYTSTGELDNGRLETDRPHVFNFYGAYIFDWKRSRANSTELSIFQIIASGTPQTSRIFLVSTITPAIFTQRGDLGRSPTFSQTDFNITHRYRFGRDNRFTLVGDLNILNLFNQDTVTNYYTIRNLNTSVITGPVLGFPNNGIAFTNAYTSGSLLTPINTYLAGTPTVLNRLDARYGQPFTFQSPRAVRFGFRLIF